MNGSGEMAHYPCVTGIGEKGAYNSKNSKRILFYDQYGECAPGPRCSSYMLAFSTSVLNVSGFNAHSLTHTGVAVDDENGIVFVAGYTVGELVPGGPGGDAWAAGERDTFNDFLAIAMDDQGNTIWAYQDTGRFPSQVRREAPSTMLVAAVLALLRTYDHFARG